VAYRIQNLDFGTFIGIVDDVPLNNVKRKAQLVIRPRKEGIHTQEWIFNASSNGTWTISNHGANFAITNTATAPSNSATATSNSATATFFIPRNGLPNAPWTIEQENENIIKIRTGDKVLKSTTGSDLEIGEDTDQDKVRWRLVEVCPILGQVGFKYRLRGLNGRILNRDAYNGHSAMVLADALRVGTNKTRWEVEPAANGRCVIKAHGGGVNDYLSAQSTMVNGQPNWTIVSGPKFDWDIDFVAGLAYQIIKPGDDKSLAVTIENDTNIYLKPNKVGHGQLWLVERDYN